MQKKNRLLSIFLLILLMSLSSCRYQPQLLSESDFQNISTWAELFKCYWYKMNTNYVFWSNDYESGYGWDAVYTEYLPKFEALGEIVAGGEKSEQAYQYFHELTRNLSEGHYNIQISDGSSERIYLSPLTYRLLVKAGYKDENYTDPDSIYQYFRSYELNSAGTSYSFTSTDHTAYTNLLAERTSNILSHTFGLAKEERISLGRYNIDYNGKAYTAEIFKGSLANTPSGFSSVQYLIVEGSPYDISVILAESSEGILYFSFSNFFFTYLERFSFPDMDNPVEEVLETFKDKCLSAKGIIIDLRGNSGGAANDIKLVWDVFLDGQNIHYMDFRYKDGDNRLDYGPWIESSLEGTRSYGFDKSKPVAIIVNCRSASCSEQSLMLLRTLKSRHGYNIRTFGEKTAGAFGFIYSSENYANAGRTSIEPYIISMYCASNQVRDLDGINYEGTGIGVDQEVPFDYDSFISNSGTLSQDGRLNAAYEWVKGAIR